MLGALKMLTWQKQYKIHVPSSTPGREKETLLKTYRQECALQRALCPRANRHTAPCSERWHMAQPSWYHPNAPEFQCSRSAVSLWFLLGGLDCGKRAPLHLARAWEQLQFETYKYFFTPSSFQLMCRWKPHRWSVGENPCLAKDGLLLLWNAIRALGAEGFFFFFSRSQLPIQGAQIYTEGLRFLEL